MPTRQLPENPSLENLKKQAKTLLKSIDSDNPEPQELVKEFHPRGEGALAEFALNDAQLVLARVYGFASWAKLKEYIEEVATYSWTPPGEGHDGKRAQSEIEKFIRFSCLAYDAWWCPAYRKNAREILREHPEFATDDIYGAAAVGNVAAVQMLLARDGALANWRGGPFQWEPLLYACYSRFDSTEPGYSTLEVARVLLKAGANPNAGFLWKGNVPPFTALTGAFGNGEAGSNEPPHQYSAELARLLLEAGADSNDGQTLYNCHFRPDDTHLKVLFQYGLGQDKGGPWYRKFGEKLDSPTRLLVEELWAAARLNYFDRVKLLVEHGAEVNTPGKRDGRTPYEAAVRAGNQGIAEYLLEHGAKKIELSLEERFAAACIRGDETEARGVLQQKPDLLATMGRHRRIELIHRAVEARRKEGVALMARLGFEFSETTRHDGVGINLAATPLHNAAWIGDLEMVKLLLELGADPTVRDPNYNSTPLGWANFNQQPHVVEYLSQFGTIFEAVQGDNLERAEMLLAEDSSRAKESDNWGFPLLIYVNANGKNLEKMVDLLLRHGSDLNAKSRDGRTPLEYAVERGNERVARVLRQRGE